MECRTLSPRDPDECTRPPDDAHAIFGKSIAAADMALEPTEGFGLNGADMRRVAYVPHGKFAAGGSSVGSLPTRVPPRT